MRTLAIHPDIGENGGDLLNNTGKFQPRSLKLFLMNFGYWQGFNTCTSIIQGVCFNAQFNDCRVSFTELQEIFEKTGRFAGGGDQQARSKRVENTLDPEAPSSYL